MSNLPKASGPAAKALAETNEMIAQAREATKKRKLWAYARNDVLLDWARKHEKQGVRDLAALIDAGITFATPRAIDATAQQQPPSIATDGYELIDAPPRVYVPGNLSPNETMAEIIRIFFDRTEDAVVEAHHDTAADKYMFAVWMGEGPTPTVEPQF